MPTKYDDNFFTADSPVVVTPAATATSRQPANPFDTGFFIDGGDAVSPADDNRLTPEQLAALTGAAAGKFLGRPATISGTGSIPQAAEKLYGAPSGSLADVQTVGRPESIEAITKKVAENLVPEVPGKADLPVTPERATPGGRYAEKTGYGAGEGTVEDVVTRRNRRKGEGKIVSALDKKYGVAQPGEPTSLIDRLLERSAKAEQAAALKVQIDAQNVIAEAERVKALEARQSTLAKMAENIQRAGGASGIVQQALRTGVNVGSGILGGLHGFQGASDMQKQGVTPSNAAQTIEGGALLYALRNPTIGFPVAGTAALTRAGQDMYKNGPNLENAAQVASGAGMIVMPRSPLIGAMLQIPGLGLAAQQYLTAHPELIPAFLKSAKAAAPVQ